MSSEQRLQRQPDLPRALANGDDTVTACVFGRDLPDKARARTLSARDRHEIVGRSALTESLAKPSRTAGSHCSGAGSLTGTGAMPIDVDENPAGAPASSSETEPRSGGRPPSCCRSNELRHHPSRHDGASCAQLFSGPISCLSAERAGDSARRQHSQKQNPAGMRSSMREPARSWLNRCFG